MLQNGSIEDRLCQGKLSLSGKLGISLRMSCTMRAFRRRTRFATPDQHQDDGPGRTGLVCCRCAHHLFLSINSWSSSTLAPVISPTFSPFLYSWKVGATLTPAKEGDAISCHDCNSKCIVGAVQCQLYTQFSPSCLPKSLLYLLQLSFTMETSSFCSSAICCKVG